MSTQHTQGLLTLSRLGNVTGGPERQYTNGTGKDQLFMPCIPGDDNGTREANARRLVACWNKFDGISTEAIEQSRTVMEIAKVTGEAGEFIFSLVEQVTTLESQRDELLTALKMFADALPLDSDTCKTCYAVNNDMRDAAHAALENNGV